jgi:hypothetical protein
MFLVNVWENRPKAADRFSFLSMSFFLLLFFKMAEMTDAQSLYCECQKEPAQAALKAPSSFLGNKFDETVAQIILEWISKSFAKAEKLSIVLFFC